MKPGTKKALIAAAELIVGAAIIFTMFKITMILILIFG